MKSKIFMLLAIFFAFTSSYAVSINITNVQYEIENNINDENNWLNLEFDTQNDFGEYTFEYIIYSKYTNTIFSKIEKVRFYENVNHINISFEIYRLSPGNYDLILFVYDNRNRLIYGNESVFDFYFESYNDMYITLYNINYYNEYIEIPFISNVLGDFDAIYTLADTIYSTKIENQKLVLKNEDVINKDLKLLYFKYNDILYIIDDDVEIDYSYMNKSFIQSAIFYDIYGLVDYGYYTEVVFVVSVFSNKIGNYMVEADVFNEYNQYVGKINSSYELDLGYNEVYLSVDSNLIFNSRKDGRYNLRNIKLYSTLNNNSANNNDFYYGNFDYNNLVYIYDASTYSIDASYFEFNDWGLFKSEFLDDTDVDNVYNQTSEDFNYTYIDFDNVTNTLNNFSVDINLSNQTISIENNNSFLINNSDFLYIDEIVKESIENKNSVIVGGGGSGFRKLGFDKVKPISLENISTNLSVNTSVYNVSRYDLENSSNLGFLDYSFENDSKNFDINFFDDSNLNDNSESIYSKKLVSAIIVIGFIIGFFVLSPK